MYRLKFLINGETLLSGLMSKQSAERALSIQKRFGECEIVPDKDYATCLNCEHRRGRMCRDTHAIELHDCCELWSE